MMRRSGEERNFCCRAHLPRNAFSFHIASMVCCSADLVGRSFRWSEDVDSIAAPSAARYRRERRAQWIHKPLKPPITRASPENSEMINQTNLASDKCGDQINLR